MTERRKPAARSRGEPATNGRAERVPPSNVEAERSLIGAALLDTTAVEILMASVGPGDFNTPVHVHIVEAMRVVVGRNVPVDAVTVGEELRSAGLLDTIGGPSYLAELTIALPAVSAAAHYAGIVRDTSTLRRLIHAGADIADVAFTTGDAAVAVARAQEIVDGIPRSTVAALNPIDLVDWHDVYRGASDELMYVEGLAHPGRWTALVAAAKAGKSTLLVCLFCDLSRGLDPFDRTRCEPVGVLYVDAEMGRVDIRERLEALGLRADELDRFHYTDLPPRLDTLEGGQALVSAALQLGVGTVVIDGINGVVSGPENEDTTWRLLYDCTIAPLKRAGLALTTSDNLGKDKNRGPRGSSVKTDKADAIVLLTRTGSGVQLTTTHRRTFAYPTETLLDVAGLDGSEPIAFRRTDSAWPAGTGEAIELLDELEVPVDLGRNRARAALNSAKETAEAAGDTLFAERFKVRNDALSAAIRYRKSAANEAGDRSGTGPRKHGGDSHGDSLPGFEP